MLRQFKNHNYDYCGVYCNFNPHHFSSDHFKSNHDLSLTLIKWFLCLTVGLFTCFSFTQCDRCLKMSHAHLRPKLEQEEGMNFYFKIFFSCALCSVVYIWIKLNTHKTSFLAKNDWEHFQNDRKDDSINYSFCLSADKTTIKS